MNYYFIILSIILILFYYLIFNNKIEHLQDTQSENNNIINDNYNKLSFNITTLTSMINQLQTKTQLNENNINKLSSRIDNNKKKISSLEEDSEFINDLIDIED